MRNLVLTLLMCLPFSELWSQTIQWDGSESSLNIGERVGILEDPKGSFTIEDVSVGGQKDDFQPSGRVILSFGVTDAFQWIKFSIDNKSTDKLWLELAQPNITRAQFFYKDSLDQWQLHEAGYEVPLQETFMAEHHQLFPLDDEGGTYYVRFKTVTSPVPVKIWSERALLKKATIQKIGIGIFTGILIFVILNSLMMGMSLGQNMYYFYAVNVALYFLDSAIVLDCYVLYFVDGIDLMYWYNLIPTVHMAYSVFYAVVFLDIKRYLPKYYKPTIAISLLLLGFAIAQHFLPLLLVIKINMGLALFNQAINIFLGFKAKSKGNKIGSYFGFAYIIYFSLIVLQIVYIEFGTPPYLLDLSHSTIATLLEVLILAYALSKYIEWEREAAEAAKLEARQQLLEKTLENEKMVKERNDFLEQKVMERTAVVESQKKELEDYIFQLKKTQHKLIESEKMASLGQLTAGVAHEINNPINFISNGVQTLRENFRDIKASLSAYLGLDPTKATEKHLRQLAEQDRHNQVADALEDSEMLFPSIENGVERTVNIVRSLRNFSRLDENEFKKSNLHEGLDSTLQILQNQIKKKAVVVRDYGEIPPVTCAAGKLNQVFLNLINNALQAIEEQGKITISSRHDVEKDQVVIRISDTGKGMTAEVKNKIFDPFFTTKPVGEGTGLGLSISYGIIKDHHGHIEVESEPGKGSTFLVYLPV